MKVLVAVKRVIDYNAKVRIRADHSDVDLSNTKMAMNPFCEIAVEEAVRLKEAGTADEVIVVSIGDKACQEQIRYALALGADRGIQVAMDDAPSALDVARMLAQICRREQAGLVVLGKQAIDSDNNQTGQMLAALLGWPQATFASKLVIADGRATVTREVDGGLMTLEMALPAVVTTDLRLNEPRFAALPKIMQAKRKPLQELTPSELGVELSGGLELLAVEPPAGRESGVRVGSVDELLDKLRNEACVL